MQYMQGEMPVIHFFLLLLFSLGVASKYDDGCEMTRCRDDGPVIKFPFRLKNKQPQSCGYPGFDLSCTQNSKDTILDFPFPFSINNTEFPTSVKLIVEKIDYKFQLVHISETQGCLPRLLNNLNFSASPFYFECSSDFTLFNCLSAKSNRYMSHVPCFSRPGNQVYAVKSGTLLYTVPLFSCSKLYNFSSVPCVLLNRTISLVLKWSQPMCRHCESQGKYCRLRNDTESHTECFRIPSPGLSKQPIITGGILGFLTLILAVLGIYKIFSTNKLRKEEQARIERYLVDYKSFKPTRYSYADIKKITNKFSHKLGERGSVYKGKLSSNIFVAVKVLESSKGNGEDFINEVGTLVRIHHINVVRLVGYCADGFTRTLVYEFLANHSLEKFLSPKNHSNHSICWEIMQQIALGIAKGIEYLHQGCDKRILHLDIRPHNILLDHNFTPKISDFGLAKLCSKEDSSTISMTAARGTIGYIAPEMFLRKSGNVSCKSDVYSFGMLILEMVGERNDDFEATANRTNDVYKSLNEKEEATFKIYREGDVQIAKKLKIVGLWCIQWYPANRPSMKAVIQMLEGEKSLRLPPNPFGPPIQ